MATDHKNRVRAWSRGREHTTRGPHADLWLPFWEEEASHRDILLLHTRAHRESRIARDMASGRSPDLFLGNALADLAAGIDEHEASVDYATTDYVDRVDAVSVKLLKRLVALGIRAAELPRTRPAKRCHVPRDRTWQRSSPRASIAWLRRPRAASHAALVA